MADVENRIRDWLLVSVNLGRVEKNKYEVAVLPVGAIEPHNRHLPQGQDFLHTTHLAQRCSEMAWQKCHSVLCLPALPYGVDCNLLEFPFAIHISQSTLDVMIREIIVSLRKHGIRKIVIFNGHGGNEFKPLIRQIQCDMDVFVFCCNWWQVGMDCYDEIFTAPEDHAGQMETSVAMALHPELVEIDLAGHGRIPEFRFKALRAGWVKTSRNFAMLNDHCAIGSPKDASAEKGRKYIDIVCSRISEFLVELAQSPIDEHFPYKR